jgi:hypothetical protein
MTDEEVDRLLLALSGEGFALPFAARVSDFMPEGQVYTAQSPELRALKAADTEAWEQNRGALRKALRAAIS